MAVGFDEQQILDEATRECSYNFVESLGHFFFSLVLKYGFKKIAKSNDYIRIEDIGDAFRHAGQNPSEDIVKDLIEKARAMKLGSQTDREEDRKC